MKINEALNIKDEKRTKAIKEADMRRDELHLRLPRVAEIDAQIRAFSFRALNGESADKLRADSERLNDERANLLTAAGYSPDYDEPKFECSQCNDSGYVKDLKVCSCVKNMVANSNYTESSLARGLIDKNFDNFSLKYYSEENGERIQMEKALKGCKKYAENFPNDEAAGILFTGGTGLGKTHLSAAIANAVAAKGMSVIYESAQQIFDTCDAVRFNRLELSERKKYENCKLLVIDDLGAECITQYSVSSIASLIDLRIVNGRKTIISTNLTPDKIRKTYGERTYSRLLGEFRVLKFMGKDIRMQKIKGIY